MARLRFGNDRHWIEPEDTGKDWMYCRENKCSAYYGHHLTPLVDALRDKLVEAREILAEVSELLAFANRPFPAAIRALKFLARTQVTDPPKSVFPVQVPPKSDPTEFREWVVQVTAALNELASRLPDKTA